MNTYAALAEWRWSLEELYQDRNLHPYPSGQPIDLNLHEIWVVYRGVVQLSTIHPSGEEVMLGFAGPSTPFGMPLTTLNPYFAVSLTTVDLMRLTLVEVEQSPTLAQGLFWHLLRRQKQTESMLSMANYRRVEDRLRQFLLILHQELGQKVGKGSRLPIRLTHQHIANAIGSTRVTVTRMLGQLQSEGWIWIDPDRHFVLTDQG